MDDTIKSAHEIATEKMDKDEYVSKNKTEVLDTDELYGIKEPKQSCKECHGRGVEGWQPDGKPILCRCLRRSGKGNWITWGHFQYLSRYTRNIAMGLRDEVPIEDSEAVHKEESEEVSG